MSVLRGKCPYCGTFTAVAVGPGYECHSCGREFAAGLVRVPRAWGDGGEEMIQAAGLPLPYPEVAVIEEASLGEQELAMASTLPERPLVLGGCCCSHVGALEGLSSRYDRLALVWFDAHGDLNTPETSPSGNQWGMPFRMVLDAGSVAVENAVLVGARDLDPGEEQFIIGSGLHTGADAIEAALGAADAVYVAFDADVLDEGEMASFMPEPGGMTLAQAETLLAGIAAVATVVGAGLTGFTPASDVDSMTRLVAALGL